MNRSISDLKIYHSLDMPTIEAYSIESIREAHDHAVSLGMELCLSDSGGKDSGVLRRLMEKSGIPFHSVVSNTGLEYPEVIALAIRRGATVVRPKKSFLQVLEDHGYPVISKKTAMMIRKIRSPKAIASRNLYLNGVTSDGRECRSYILAKRWRFLIDAPFKISDRCCDIIKKQPLVNYCKKNNYLSVIGVTAEESEFRRIGWLNNGCNSFNQKLIQSRPIMVWSEQQILQYCLDENIEIASVYGDIIQVDLFGHLSTSKLRRTGCIYCMFGIYEEAKKGKHRFDELLESHPKLWDVAINKLKIGMVLDFIGIKYIKPKGEDDE